MAGCAVSITAQPLPSNQREGQGQGTVTSSYPTQLDDLMEHLGKRGVRMSVLRINDKYHLS